jgi:LAO/AO transport system kinase
MRNPKYSAKSRPPDRPERIFKELRSGNRMALSRALTLVESRQPQHQKMAEEILDRCLPFTGNSVRVGITGSPGVGKSTFIESLGIHTLREGHQMAVLAVDPSSSVTRGSLLGDKTRMEQLARNERAFIRPSPASETLGGVAHSTKESILLCEAAGYDLIVVETVGVGQSETLVREMVDFFLLLILPGAGDDLQGIKRGIVELADLIVINKADGSRRPLARQTQRDFKRALHLFPASTSNWSVQVLLASAQEHEGIADIWTQIQTYMTQENSAVTQRRAEQNAFWLDYRFRDLARSKILNLPGLKEALDHQKEQLLQGKQSLTAALRILDQELKRHFSS